MTKVNFYALIKAHQEEGMSIKNRPLWPWKLDRVLIFFEALYFLIAFLLTGGMDRLAAALDSFVELWSNGYTLRFAKQEEKYRSENHDHSDFETCEHDHESHDHTRERATENVAITFFVLGGLSLAIHVLFGEIETTDSSWFESGAWFFTIATAVLGVVKLVKSGLQKGSPKLADALQSLLCVGASLVTIIANRFHTQYPNSHVVGEIFIVAIMFVAGTWILKSKKLCC